MTAKKASVLDRIADDIAKASRVPETAGRQSSHSLVDPEILEGIIGPDEMGYEHDSATSYRQGFVFLRDHPEEVREGDCVELHGEGRECDCEPGVQCQICCTQRDLVDIPRALYRELDRKRTPSGEDLFISMSEHLARAFGLLDPRYV